MNDRLLSYRDVVRETTLSESTIRRLIEAGRFPRPVRLRSISRRVAFLGSQVSAAMDALLALDETAGTGTA
jgi:predicted DNA-binding transcriptional regulator AlpA